jgi:hypothetical protein
MTKSLVSGAAAPRLLPTRYDARCACESCAALTRIEAVRANVMCWLHGGDATIVELENALAEAWPDLHTSVAPTRVEILRALRSLRRSRAVVSVFKQGRVLPVYRARGGHG